MTIEAQANDIAQDGSIKIKVDGKEVKYVKESDLGAVKGALSTKDGEVTKLQADLATANTKASESHQDVLKGRAALEVAEKGSGESATLKTKVGELETKVADLEKAGGETATRLTDRVRSTLVDGFKIPEDKVKDMALDALEQTEKTLILTGAKPASANYDGKGGGGEGGASAFPDGMSPLQRATALYNENDKKT